MPRLHGVPALRLYVYLWVSTLPRYHKDCAGRVPTWFGMVFCGKWYRITRKGNCRVLISRKQTLIDDFFSEITVKGDSQEFCT